MRKSRDNLTDRVKCSGCREGKLGNKAPEDFEKAILPDGILRRKLMKLSVNQSLNGRPQPQHSLAKNSLLFSLRYNQSVSCWIFFLNGHRVWSMVLAKWIYISAISKSIADCVAPFRYFFIYVFLQLVPWIFELCSVTSRLAFL